MLNSKFLNNKESKDILKQVEAQWGAKLSLEFTFLKNNKNRIFMVSDEIKNIDLEKLRINSIGLYFCEIGKDIRLTIEGSQLIGPKATKNILEISDEQVKQWLRGEDLDLDSIQELSGFVILKNGSDFLGTGKFKENKILNYLGKSRRISSLA
jgi:NOL1/NOP2/fmu family ribosome biogenesis protein